MDIKNNISGLQHIGIPVSNLEETITFYESLGFKIDLKTEIEEDGDKIQVAFMGNNNLVLEFYQQEGEDLNEVLRRKDGHIDHIALDVKDVKEAYSELEKMNYNLIDDELQFIPFFEKGVKYFRIKGPDDEIIEFNQKL